MSIATDLVEAFASREFHDLIVGKFLVATLSPYIFYRMKFRIRLPTVIVPTHRGPLYCPALLKARALCSDFEIIVVDDASTNDCARG